MFGLVICGLLELMPFQHLDVAATFPKAVLLIENARNESVNKMKW